jgi:hypothetical protein
MVRTDIKMVHAAQIASWGFPGCKTVQGVANFCQKHKNSVYCVWWKHNNKKILLVDPKSFRQTWKKVHGSTGNMPKRTNRSTSFRNYGKTYTRTYRTKRTSRRAA